MDSTIVRGIVEGGAFSAYSYIAYSYTVIFEKKDIYLRIENLRRKIYISFFSNYMFFIVTLFHYQYIFLYIINVGHGVHSRILQ